MSEPPPQRDVREGAEGPPGLSPVRRVDGQGDEPGKSSTLGKRLNTMEKICCVFMRVVFARDTAPADGIERFVPSSIT